MKLISRIFLLLLFCIIIINIYAEEEKKINKENQKEADEYIIVYDVFKHKETASNIYLGIAGLSLGIGTGILANAGNNEFLFGVGVQNIIWGLGEACVYTVSYTHLRAHE
ncbi:MAG: hypothetical protein N2114_03085, partial [Candidatus Goldbacteria bacterium]|nr:hypothetical protein [Candidatus Goldiibacteriota bacterium]